MKKDPSVDANAPSETKTKENPITVKVGDTVLYGKYSGTELKLENNDYLIMRESDILAIV